MALSSYVPLEGKSITMPELYYMLNLLDMGMHEVKTTQQISDLWKHLSDIFEDFAVSESVSQYYDIQYYLDRCNSEKWTELFSKIDKKFITKKNEILVSLRSTHEADVLSEKNLITPDLVKEAFINFVDKINNPRADGVFLFQAMRDKNEYEPDKMDAIIEYAAKEKKFYFLVNLKNYSDSAYFGSPLSKFLQNKSKYELLLLAENKIENNEDLSCLLSAILYQSVRRNPNKDQELNNFIKRILDKDLSKGQLFDKTMIKQIILHSKYDFFDYPLYAYLRDEVKEKVKESYLTESIEYEKKLFSNEIVIMGKKNEIRRI